MRAALSCRARLTVLRAGSIETSGFRLNLHFDHSRISLLGYASVEMTECLGERINKYENWFDGADYFDYRSFVLERNIKDVESVDHYFSILI